jgi:hypothetical protein
MLFLSLQLDECVTCRAGDAYTTSYSRVQATYEKNGYYAKARVGFIFLA